LDLACAIAVPAGADAADRAGDVYCWGRNDHFSIGIPDPATQSVAVPHKIDGFASDVIAVDVGDGTRHVCAIRRDATVWCWGDDFQGRMGTVPGTPPQIDCPPFANHCSAVPVQIRVQETSDAGADAGDLGLGAALTQADQIRLGDGSSCVLRKDGTLWCWGNNDAAALSTPGPFVTTIDHPGARLIAGFPAGIRELTRHFRTTLAMTATGAWWGLGENSYGELGAGSAFGTTCEIGICVVTPIGLPGLQGITKIGAGDRFFVGIGANNTVLAWGRNEYAQLGHTPGTKGDGVCTGFDTVACGASPAALIMP
jgi:alpha-tubulin suppressor-like RCC1 family protein